MKIWQDKHQVHEYKLFPSILIEGPGMFLDVCIILFKKYTIEFVFEF